jgi:hypothetical protein
MNMIKTKFTLERSIVGCLIAFCVVSVIFTGCGKDYDSDIARLTRINKEQDSILNSLQAQITAIQNNIANARWITAVTPTATGYEIHFNSGSPNPVTINHGTAGTAGTVWQIGPGYTAGTHVDSVWHIITSTGGIVETEYIAIPPRGRDGVDGAPGTPIPVKAPDIVGGYWATYEWNAATNDFTQTIHTEYPLVSDLMAYVVDNPNNLNQWILRVKKGATGNDYQDIILPKNEAGMEGNTGSITLIGHVSSPNPVSLPLSAIDTSTIVVKYWYLDSIYDVAQSVRVEAWSGQKDVRPKQLLTTLPKELSLVLTSDISLSNTSKFKNSRGEVLPLAIGAPVPYTGLLTKAEISGGPVYLAPLSIVDSTYATNTDLTNKFTNKFVANAIYYLETETGIKSNYSPFSISVENHSADVAATANVTQFEDVEGGGIAAVNNKAAGVIFNRPYAVGFANSFDLYDYSMEDNSPLPGNIVIYPAFGTFRAMQAGIYSLIVRKLHVDGKIYADTITVTAN